MNMLNSLHCEFCLQSCATVLMSRLDVHLMSLPAWSTPDNKEQPAGMTGTMQYVGHNQHRHHKVVGGVKCLTAVVVPSVYRWMIIMLQTGAVAPQCRGRLQSITVATMLYIHCTLCCNLA